MVAKMTRLVLLGSALIISLSDGLFADGLIIVDPFPGKWIEPARLTVKYHHVTVAIDYQVATTKVDQVFENPYDYAVEGTYIFPVPEQASIHAFTLNVDGKSIKTKILTKDEASVEYESLVKTHKDSALLEFMGDGMVQARLSTIGAHSSIRVNLEYTELLTAHNGTVMYHYTLGTEKFSAQPLDDVVLAVTIKAPQAILNVYSPTHKIAVQPVSQTNVAVSYEEKKVRPLHDFILYYTVSEDEIGFNVLTYKDGQEDGYFLAMMSPNNAKDKQPQPVIAKNIVFVVDRSGSMAGKKIEQAKQALAFCLERLNARDHFNVISFDDAVDLYQENLAAATSANIQGAKVYVKALRDRGGTDIDTALKAALAQFPAGDAPNMIIFLTDGQPTVGECNIHHIAKNAKGANATKVRLFSFGVGYDVNTALLDKISLDNRGTSDYIEPQENIEAKVSQFYLKIAQPILTDLALSFSGTQVSELYPLALPDLFHGSQLLVVGRYSTGGRVELDLAGKQNAAEKHYVFVSEFVAQDMQNDFLPRIWAGRKIANLVDQIVLEGRSQTLIDEIVKLSRRYGIITEYTLFLVDADAQVFGKGLVTQDMFDAASSSLCFASCDQVGKSSVARAKTQQIWRGATVDMSEATNALYGAAETIRGVRSRAFYKKDNKWIDADHTDASQVVNIKVFGNAYFDLLKKMPDLHDYLALGNNVIIKVGDYSICVDDEGSDDVPVAVWSKLCSK